MFVVCIRHSLVDDLDDLDDWSLKSLLLRAWHFEDILKRAFICHMWASGFDSRSFMWKEGNNHIT